MRRMSYAVLQMRYSTIAQMRCLAQRRGGECISRQYISSKIPLWWRCRRGHQWSAMPTNVSRGSWCPTCAHRKRLTLGEMRALAGRREGECISDQYVNNGHCWRAVPVAVRRDSRCPVCARNRKLTLEEFRSLAARKGGRCLSDHYANKSTPLRWQCALGHRWSAQPGRVRRGAWCAIFANLRRRSRWRPGHGRAKLRLRTDT
jgi:hypothetical protein